LRQLLSGNEAIALGAYHAGIAVATAYPGTPSTEITETLAKFDGLYVEWSTNEKVALEVAMGASYGGVRALAAMKHVGLNVAADAFFGVAVTGVNGGLVIVSADDPGLHSSQGEQDNRRFAPFARVPMFEPTDSNDAYKLMDWLYQISEIFDTPVLLRSTTRISHCKSIVEVNKERQANAAKPAFKHSPAKYVMVPANARVRRLAMGERAGKLAAYSEHFPMNEIIRGSHKLGVISSGIGYQYAREVFPDASFLKLVMTWPLPAQMIKDFVKEVDKVIVVEELDPYLEEQIRLMGIAVAGKAFISPYGELNTDIVKAGAMKAGLIPRIEKPTAKTITPPLPPRPPLLCAGCPHRAAEYALRRLGFRSPDEKRAPGEIGSGGIVITGDIGCYTLGVMPPLNALDTTVCMGASIGQALGLARAGINEKIAAVIGDSTFMHSGLTGLVDMVYNQTPITIVILDNGTTAMTGHQGNPASGISARNEKTETVDIAAIVKGAGVKNVSLVSAFDLVALKSTLKAAIESSEPAVVIVRGDCPLNKRVASKPLVVDKELCNECHICLGVGCPAISVSTDGETVIGELCVGAACDVCAQVCPRKAISEASR
jgi:indolepyruvate ferredoxin oxidoreductase alpha subunit